MRTVMAMRTTSRGICPVSFPVRLNITLIVNRSAIKVIGLIFAMNGMSRYMNASETLVLRARRKRP